MTCLKIRVVEFIANVPTKHEKLLPLKKDRMKEAKTIKKTNVLFPSFALQKLSLRYLGVQPLHVCSQALSHNNDVSSNCDELNKDLEG